MKRIFVALHISPADDRLLFLLRSARELFSQSRVAWADPSGLHLTLAFLGDTEESLITPICKALQDVSRSFSPFEFTLAGTGFFSSRKDPRVLWVGTREQESLVKLQGLVRAALIKQGISIDDKPFSPHLTLGRIKMLTTPKALDDFVERFGNMELQHNEIKDFFLYESILTPTGALYRVIQQFALTGIRPDWD